MNLDRRRRASLVAVSSCLLFLAACASNVPAPVISRAAPATASAAKVPATENGAYTVRKGDTLYSIALDNGQDYKDIAVWNGIANPDIIFIGQQLRVRPPEDATSVAVVRPLATATVVEQRLLAGNSELLKREPKAGKEPYSEQALAQAARSSEPAQPAPPLVAVRLEPRPEVKAETRPEPRVEAKAEAAAGEVAVADGISWKWPATGTLIGAFSEGVNKGIDIGGKPGDPVRSASDGKVVYSGSGLRGYGKLLIVKHNASYLSAYAHNRQVLVKEGQSVTMGQKIAEMGNTDSEQVKLHFEIRRQGKPVDPLKYLPQRSP